MFRLGQLKLSWMHPHGAWITTDGRWRAPRSSIHPPCDVQPYCLPFSTVHINFAFSFKHQLNPAVILDHGQDTKSVTMVPVSESNPSIVWNQTEKHWAPLSCSHPFSRSLILPLFQTPSLIWMQCQEQQVVRGPRLFRASCWRCLNLLRRECVKEWVRVTGPCRYWPRLIRLESVCEMSLSFTEFLSSMDLSL